MKKLFTILLVALLATLLFSAASAEYYEDDYGPSYDEIVSVTGPYSDRVLTAAQWKDGLVATLDGDEVGYFVNGKAVMIWKCPTSYEDFFVDLSKGFPNAPYSLCLVLSTGELYSFRDDISMNIEETGIYLYGFNLDYSDYFAQRGKSLDSYFFLKQDGAFYYWSPYAKVQLTGFDAQTLVINFDYIFFSDSTGVHVINASLAEMNLHDQRFFSYHPLPVINIGDVDIYEFYGGLYAIDENNEFCFEGDAINQEYGIDFSIWGSTKAEFTLHDFSYYPPRSFYRLQEVMDCPEEEYANPVIYRNISFCGYDGYLAVYQYTNSEIKQIRWVCAENRPGVDTEIEQHIQESGGVFVSSGTYEDEEISAETVFSYEGQLIHVGRRNTEDGFEIVVYANNMEILNE